jgi:hypothetical protein
MRHAAGGKARFFLKLASGDHLRRRVWLLFPRALREFPEAGLHRIAELLDEGEVALVERNDQGERRLGDDAEDPVGTIGATDPVLAQRHPLIAIDVTRGEGLDRHAPVEISLP